MPLTAPFAVPVFRRIWLASLLSNLGMLILGVGSAWAMVQMTDKADMVALVQTAIMLPIFLVSMAAGALADMFDRRKVGIIALCVACFSASLLSALAFADMLTPYVLLFFCFAVGTGIALFGPAWQSSVGEQVPGDVLPQAVALNSISYNIARSFGPAVGGLVVAAAGAVAAFVINAVFYIPLLIVLFLWRREITPSRLPPEKMARALSAGVRFIIHSPPVRIALIRCFALGITAGSIFGLMPMVAKELLAGSAQTYGLVLCAFGVGAVLGALLLGSVRDRMSSEGAISLSALVLGTCVIGVSLSHWLPVTMLLLVVAGAVWTGGVTLFNINIQLSAPRWVSGRALAAFQAGIAGGIAIGSWFWGTVATHYSVATALTISGLSIAATALMRVWLRVPDATGDTSQVEPGEFDIALKLTGRSGPIVIQIDYRVDPAEARDFYRAMQDLQPVRHRNGGFDWSLARDVTDPWLWTERYVCPTWHDYLRSRERNTRDEMSIITAAAAFHRGEGGVVMRRSLERPFGSVRWRAESRDEGLHDVLPVTVGPS